MPPTIQRMSPAVYDMNVTEHQTSLCPQCRETIGVGEPYVQAALAVRPMHLACRRRFLSEETARLLTRLAELSTEKRALSGQRASDRP